MACADIDMDIRADEEPHRGGRRGAPMIQYYQATEMMPDNRKPLHDLLQKHPAVLGSLQIVSGLFSVGVGILFSVTQKMENSFFTLFRVSQMTGTPLIIAGLLSNLLFKYPALLPVSFAVNCGFIIVAVAGACLISVDLADWNEVNDQHLRMEVMELCLLGFEVFLSVILCFWFVKEKHQKSP
ncbi:uncharacterized protein [Embiotoca jacksoni]|uniref:uncharacterized protein n=1 Tax=Embiotoca jacksoni TaxID=100190 RepID=UPI0037045CC6